MFLGGIIVLNWNLFMWRICFRSGVFNGDSNRLVLEAFSSSEMKIEIWLFEMKFWDLILLTWMLRAILIRDLLV